MIRTIVLWCPDWPVAAASPGSKLDPDAPLALIDRGVVFACSAPAPAGGGAPWAPAARGAVPLHRPGRRSPTTRCSTPRSSSRRHRRRRARCPACSSLGRAPAPSGRAARPATTAARTQAAAALLVLPRASSASPVRGWASPTGRSRPSRPPAPRAPTRRRIEPGAGLAPRVPRAAAGRDPRRRPSSPPCCSRLGVHTLGAVRRAARRRRASPVRRGRGAGARPLGRGRERPPGRAAHPARGSSTSASTSSRRSTGSTRSPSRSAARPTRSSTASRGPGSSAPRIRVEVRSESGEGLRTQLAAPALVHAPPTSSTGCAGSCRAAARSTPGSPSGIVRVRMAPERVDSAGTPRDGALGLRTGRDASTTGSPACRACSGTRRCSPPSIGGGRMLADRQRARAVGRPAGRATGAALRRRAAPWPGSLPRAAARDACSAERRRSLVATAGGDLVDVDDRGTLDRDTGGCSPTGGRPRWPLRRPGPARGRSPNAGGIRHAAAELHRFQVVDLDGNAWLLVLENRRWWAEARYD